MFCPINGHKVEQIWCGLVAQNKKNFSESVGATLKKFHFLFHSAALGWQRCI